MSGLRTIDLTAKLLANENITVLKYSGLDTASFDVRDRVLRLPNWGQIDNDVDAMLVGHEVGHALYTTLDMLQESIDDPILHQYINIIEDVRIEKLIKRKYPGIKKTFLQGYNKLNDDDFFGIQERGIDDLNLIDKINLYFKVGLSSNILFDSDDETSFVNRAEKTETPADVVSLAREVLEYSRSLLNDLSSKYYKDLKFNIDDTPEDEIPFSDDMGDDYFDGDTSQIDKMLDDMLRSSTDDVFKSRLSNITDNGTEYHYLKLDTNYDSNFVIPYKTVISDTAEMDESEFLDVGMQNYKQFRDDTDRAVSYLVKEFEMKKSAQAYKRTQVSKSGSLDMSKVWGFQLNDDLFKRINITRDSKNHGMIFLLDWSGSMSGNMHDTVEQLIQLVTFCFRIRIPFRVYAFTGYYANSKISKYERRECQAPDTINNACNNVNLLEFFTSKMNLIDFNLMCKRLYRTARFTMQSGYYLGSTPLNNALAYMTDYIGKFSKQENIEKMTFITLTDGEGDTLRVEQPTQGHHTKKVIIDPVTKLQYNFSWYSAAQTQTLLTMIKDRYEDINIIGYFVADSVGERSIHNIFSNNAIKFDYNNQYLDLRKHARQHGFIQVKGGGRDSLFIIPSSALKLKDVELDIGNAVSSNAISKKFTKMLKTNRTNKVLLTKFINFVA